MLEYKNKTFIFLENHLPNFVYFWFSMASDKNWIFVTLP